MKLSQRLDIIVLVLVILYVLTGCTFTTNPERDLGACVQWRDVQREDKKCTLPGVGAAERICVHTPYVTTVCVARESSI